MGRGTLTSLGEWDLQAAQEVTKKRWSVGCGSTLKDRKAQRIKRGRKQCEEEKRSGERRREGYGP